MLNIYKLNLIVTITFALIPFSSMAQNALPVGISPFANSIKLSLNPTHKAQCSIKSIEKKEGDFFGTRQNLTTTQEVLRSAGGELSYSVDVKGFEGMSPSDSMGLTFPIGADGSVGKESVFKTNLSLAQNELDFLKKIIDDLVGGNALEWVRNKPLRYGAIISAPDLCKNVGKMLNSDFKVTKKGGFKVMGISFISGRESIVIDGSASLSCSSEALNFDMRSSGWWSFDLQSGLQNGGSTINSLLKSGEKQVNLQQDYICNVSGIRSEPVTSSSPPAVEKNSELRLSELKSLFEKNLISKEQYDQKISEILKSL
jgi:hypothetical protein